MPSTVSWSHTTVWEPLLSSLFCHYSVEHRYERVLCCNQNIEHRWFACSVSLCVVPSIRMRKQSSARNIPGMTWIRMNRIVATFCTFAILSPYLWLHTPFGRGTLRSLDGCFADIKLSSLITDFRYPYHVTAENLTASTCNEASVKESVQEQNVHKGPVFCDLLAKRARGFRFSVQQKWPCNVSHGVCSRIGPFTNARDYKYTESGLFVQELLCVNPNFSKAQRCVSRLHTRVMSAVIGLLGKRDELGTGTGNTGYNNGMTLTAEGSCDSKSGVLCMAACRGNESDLDLQTTAREDCDVRICLYIPKALTIVQRSTIVGNISSTRQFDVSDTSTVPKFFHPFSFFQPYSPGQDDVQSELLPYEYTKTKMALALLDRHESTRNLRNWISRATSSLFRYPELGDDVLADEIFVSDLSVEMFGKDHGEMFGKDHGLLPIGFRLIAIKNTLLIPVDPESRKQPPVAARESGGQEEIVNKYLDELKLLRVAGELNVATFADICTEGVYNPKSGKMYMMGCRAVKEEWFTLHSIGGLQQGLDCSVEVVIQYPGVSSIWIAPPSAMLTISSSRRNVDPLYFAPITLSVVATCSYRIQREGMITALRLEGALRLVTLSFMVVCILGQWRHMEKNPSSTAFISLLMLAIQDVAFAIPLINGAEALFANRASAMTDFPWEGLGLTSVLYSVKVLTLIAFLLLAWLFGKVWKARSQASLTQKWISVVSEKKVFALWAVFHFVGIVMVLVRHPKSRDLANWMASPTPSELVMRLVLEYGGLVQDLFLLPQVFGGFTWNYSGKPLRKLYYVGITMLRLLPHIYYRYMRSCVLPDFNDAEHLYAELHNNFFSKPPDTVIPILCLVLAFVVWVQQSCRNVLWARFFSKSSKGGRVKLDDRNRTFRKKTTNAFFHIGKQAHCGGEDP